ncbi:hypothetical protein FRC08_015648 [Ceratobasidium sp. 394]|nr:hypothetical protein FRC08_015648 [Ceratobasidium sp. 394]
MAHVPTAPQPDLLASLGENREEAAQRALEVLKQIEENGGSAAFEAWLKETDNGTNVSIPHELDLNFASEVNSAFSAQSNTWSKGAAYSVSCKMYTAYIRTVLEVDIEGTEYAGKGSAWGIGIGYSKFKGELTLEDGETIQSLGSNVDRFTAGVKPHGDDKMMTFIIFYGNGRLIAKLVSFELNFLAGLSGFASSFKFSRK